MLLVNKRQSLPPQVSASRKRKIVLSDDCREKRARCSWTELEYEMVLEEATLLREELELLLFVAVDLCRDLGCDDTHVRSFSATLEQIGELMASPEPLTVSQIREMCQQMLTMMQYLCRVHYNHYALVDMQDQLRECRNRFMLFICKNATMIGL
ncbi:hypothetical protein JG687_00004095 [Phytophthora cactorum]|uniref:Uncharacterized protein n=1 Tax=Phytophthora cactorum TaxID=29920 RepID=A0A8T1KG24_9STRA|nr:hypothetical protein GQ600_12032 [Phytophthora cactorum]KAG3118403.1 hypothetical protein PI125_g2921 [Phytophthora idaei]KAG2788534.1 hypothetical protein Pcac1_g2535 [Phytophthora cactorum]KAG2813363.1 hypothetical protein PC112_g14774 [Phytophthora cactorum]KAG2826363.1 hypothetical protein PC111_g8996 [Phytophthora cactorum]